MIKKPKKLHVYQLGLRRADDEQEKFILERDLIYRETKVTEEEAKEIATKYKCDVWFTYLGTLVPPKTEELNVKIVFHDESMIQERIAKWNKNQEVIQNAESI